MPARLYDVTPLAYDQDVYVYQFRGKSTHEKPVYEKMATGSEFFEIDTGDVYFFDEDTGTWLKAGDDGE